MNTIKEPRPSSERNKDYIVEVKDPFSILVKRKLDGEILLDTSDFVYSNQYLRVSTKLPTRNPNIYGLGERVHNFRLDTNSKFYAMHPLDRYTHWYNLYSAHPVYVEKRKDKAHGIYLCNSNSQNVHLNHDIVTFRTIGGVLHLYLFTGPTPEEVLQQYHRLIGLPALPPRWALGFHQSRYGYKDIQTVTNVWNQYRRHQIPLDVMWNDIDYMDAYKLYTWHPQRYPPQMVKKFVEQLHDNHQKYVVIVDPGVKVEPGYFCYDIGLRDKVFITEADGKTPIINKVWPGFTAFPDFSLKNRTDPYWETLIRDFLGQVPVDGLWIDMNEIAGFCDGSCTPSKLPSLPNNKSHPIASQTGTITSEFDMNNPPYVPTDHKLYHKTLWMDAQTSLGPQYNTHSLYGHLEAISTYKALTKIHPGKRPFILTRSSFPGSGAIAGKWSGDNISSWLDLFMSISFLLTFNIFGIPLSGADICGFQKDTNEELCIRWHQLGSFYPFSRNHNEIGARDQEPFAFSNNLIQYSRSALLNRYSLLPYYYTLFYNVNQYGGSVIKSLPFEFPKDDLDIINLLDRQFLVGSALLVSPVLEQGANTVHAYLPRSEVWYNFYTGARQVQNGWVTLPAPISTIPVHIRGGFIVPRQLPGLTTEETSENPYYLNVALSSNGSARGEVYIDDGEALDSVTSKKYTHLLFQADGGNRMTMKVEHRGFDVSSLIYQSFSIYGVRNACQVTVDGSQINEFHFAAGVLNITDQKLSLQDPHEITWSTAC